MKMTVFQFFFAVQDIDSEHLSTFDDIDKNWLEKVAELFT